MEVREKRGEIGQRRGQEGGKGRGRGIEGRAPMTLWHGAPRCLNPALLEISQPKSDDGTDEVVSATAWCRHRNVDVYIVHVNVRNVTCDRNVLSLATGST